jgi:hypothetical protein
MRYYFGVATNSHKHPWISHMMCAMGRHDYEAMTADNEQALLQCFYCMHQKHSHFPHKLDAR